MHLPIPKYHPVNITVVTIVPINFGNKWLTNINTTLTEVFKDPEDSTVNILMYVVPRENNSS